MAHEGRIDRWLTELIDYRLFSFYYRGYADSLPITEGSRVLDFGCGGGLISKCLQKRCDCIAIDNSRYWVKRAVRDAKKVIIGGENCLKGPFDAIVIHYVLHDIKDMEETLCSLMKLIKDEGMIFIREPLRKNHSVDVERLENALSSTEKIYSRRGYMWYLGDYYDACYRTFRRNSPV